MWGTAGEAWQGIKHNLKTLPPLASHLLISSAASLCIDHLVWNSLPLSLRTTQCFTTFKAKLKTQLFRTHLC